MAIGILLAYHPVTQDEAFTLLRTASQHLHVKLKDIARDVVDTGALPDLPPTRPHNSTPPAGRLRRRRDSRH